jgi:hypothetical protein
LRNTQEKSSKKVQFLSLLWVSFRFYLLNDLENKMMTAFGDDDDYENFFEQLREESKVQKEPKMDSRSRGLSSETGPQQALVESISRNTNWNEGVEKIIKQNLLIGNLEGAVECCHKCGRHVYQSHFNIKFP